MNRPPKARRVFGFNEGSAEQHELLGGKGANLAEMTRILGPERVPAGLTITTRACLEYLSGGGRFLSRSHRDVELAARENLADALDDLGSRTVSGSVGDQHARAHLATSPWRRWIPAIVITLVLHLVRWK